MAKNKQAEEVNEITSLEQALDVIAELKSALDASNKAIADYELEIESLKSKVITQSSKLNGGIDAFEVDGKTIQPKFKSLKFGDLTVYFSKDMEERMKSIPADKKAYFGDCSEDEKKSFIEKHADSFKIS